MREITRKTARALKECKKITIGNTCVSSGLGESWDLFLHGNLIAMYNPTKNQLTIRDAGRESNTTKERLNGILTVFGINDGIYQKNRTWYIGDEKRTGSKVYKVD